MRRIGKGESARFIEMNQLKINQLINLIIEDLVNGRLTTLEEDGVTTAADGGGAELTVSAPIIHLILALLLFGFGEWIL